MSLALCNGPHTKTKSAYGIELEASKKMFSPLVPIVGSEDIDDTKIVNSAVVDVHFVGSSYPSLVLIEEKVPSFGAVLVG